jgi:hypothetical protein
VEQNQVLESGRKTADAIRQGAYRRRLRQSGLASVTTALPADLLQYVTEQRDRSGLPNLGAVLAEIVSEHRARHNNLQPKDSTVSA